jgi:hypothetical protein
MSQSSAFSTKMDCEDLQAYSLQCHACRVDIPSQALGGWSASYLGCIRACVLLRATREGLQRLLHRFQTDDLSTICEDRSPLLAE